MKIADGKMPADLISEMFFLSGQKEKNGDSDLFQEILTVAAETEKKIIPEFFVSPEEGSSRDAP